MPYLKLLTPLTMHADTYDDEEIGYNWNNPHLFMQLSQAMIYHDIEFNQIDKILSALGGSLVIVKGVIFGVTIFLVRNKWMKSIVNTVQSDLQDRD